jgi:WD40 repeat protein
MTNKAIALTCLSVFLCVIFGRPLSAAETVSTPRRLFGLGDVRQIAVSIDQRFMATAGQGGAFLWNLQTGELLERLETDWAVTALAFSPNSQLLLGASRTTILSWDTASGRHVRNYAGHNGEINHLEFFPDGKMFVSASADNTARIWSVESAEELHSVRTPGSPIIVATISPDGQALATLDTFLTNCVKLWDITSEAQVGFLPKTNWTAQRLAFTPSGEVVTAAPDRSVILWDIDPVQQIHRFEGVSGSATIVLDAWNPDPSTLAAACNDGTVYVWNLNTAELLHRLSGDPAIAVVGIGGSSLIVVGHLDYNLRLRELPAGQVLRTFVGHTTSTHTALAFSPDGRYVLSGGTEAATRLWNRQTGQPVRTFVGSDAGTMAASFSPDSSRVLTTVGLPNPGARLWNTETGQLEREFRWPGGWPMAAIFSHDGTKIATRSQDERIRIFDASTGLLMRTLTNSAFARAIAFSPAGPLLAFASTDSTADLYNYETNQRLDTFFANAGPVVSTVFSPGGERLVIGWLDGLLRLYDVMVLKMVGEFFVRNGFLNDTAVSPAGQYILTGEGWPFFSATLWDFETLQPIRTFLGHKWSVDSVAFSSDGLNILTGADLLREWSVADLAMRLRIHPLPDENIQLRWSVGKLQRALQLDGPWEPVTNAISPMTFPSRERAVFFRVDGNKAVE